MNRVKAGDKTPALMWRGAGGSDYSHKRVSTAMAIQYWGYPTATLQTGTGTPANGATGASLTPTLRWSGTEAHPNTNVKNFLLEVSKNSNMSSPVWNSGWTTATTATVPEGKLQQGTKYYWRVKIRDGGHGFLGQSTEKMSSVWSFTTNYPPPTPPVGSASPGSTGAPQTVTTLTPTLQVGAVTDPDNRPAGATVKYEFKIASGTDGKSGAVITSPLLTASGGVVKWQVRRGRCAMAALTRGWCSPLTG
ncbi:hypothetical protein [Microbacterium sp. NIBRBAC000506063]|uniref:glycoside hydrolase family 78 protein n=1 Tax=Microbacterium sp. NIBRBAC000506063 TaxID=2734618 RepID=UPI001BB78071|nr:hypothetical protein [Microbacterium sp. NIBRBAC000506063]QTV79399.1 hypothetical protein KAE78_10660 [Microbacterium sp. NIBRBAC000506063]